MLSFREFYEVEIAPVLIDGDCVHDEMEVGDFLCVLLAKSLLPELLVDLICAFEIPAARSSKNSLRSHP